MALSNTYTQTIKPSNSNTNGISVITSDSEVTTNTNNDKWIVTINSQSTWQFILDLGDQYTFDSEDISTIKFTINSPNPTNDLLFGFTTNPNIYQFIAIWIPMNNDGRKNHIHPQCDTSTKPTETFSNGDISILPQSNRHCDIAPGNGKHGCKWDTFRPKNAQNPKVFHYNAFPITFTFTNNPTEDTLFVSYKSAQFEPEFIQNCGYRLNAKSKMLKIYIAGNEIGDTFTVSSFDIEYNGPEKHIDTDIDIKPKLQRVLVPGVNSVVYSRNDGGPLKLKMSAQPSQDIGGKHNKSGGIEVSISMLVLIIVLTLVWFHKYYLNKHYAQNDLTEDSELSSLSQSESSSAGYEQDTEIDSMNDCEYDDIDEYEETKDEMDDDEMVERVLTLKPSDSIRVNHERVNAMNIANLSPSDDNMDRYEQDSMISDVNGDDHAFGGMVDKEIVEKSHTRISSGIPQFEENEVMDVANDLLCDMYGALM